MLIKVYLSVSRNPYVNLSMEETLFSRVKKGSPLLFLYQNDPAIVLGRYQNPWKECRTGLAARNGIPILRRISGGGTVVHGPGNLNWSIISSEKPDKESNLERMMQALSRIGLAIQRNQRHDLYFEHPQDQQLKKVSGTAFRQTSIGSIHHATLLVNADLEVLGHLLNLPPRDMDTRAVSSTKAVVANLCELKENLSMEDIISAIAVEWSGQKECEGLYPDDFQNDTDYRTFFQRLKSVEWTWKKTPDFVERFEDLPGFNSLVLQFAVREGCIAKITIPGKTDELFARKTISSLQPVVGQQYHGHALLESYASPRPEWIDALAARIDGFEQEDLDKNQIQKLR